MEESGDRDQLSFFLDFNKKFEDIKENLADGVARALEDESFSTFTRENVLYVKDSEDEDDVPLIKRLSEDQVNHHVSTKKTSSRHGRKKKESTPVIPSLVASDAVILIDSDDDDDDDDDVMICENPKLNRLCSNTSMDINTSGSVDLTVDDIDEDENISASIKINWMDIKIHRFELRKQQKFTTVFEELAKIENVPTEKILLILRDKIFITKEDTPDSLKLSILDIIEGGITKEVYKNSTGKRKTLDKNMLEFKCVLKDRKKPLLVAMKKTDTMHCLMVKTSEQLECPLEKLKFKFEGDELDSEATPEDLDLEGGEVFEVFIKH